MTTKVPATDWVSLETVAEELGVPVKTIYSWRGRGEFVRGYRFGKHVRVKRADLDAWIEGQADAARRGNPAPAA